VPTAGERLVHAQGDGSTLDVYDLPIGRLSGLICWENYMPLPRYALYARGVELYVAPTWDRGEPWISTLRHVAKEGRTYVVGCCSAVHRDSIPQRYGFMGEFLPADIEWINPGGSAIVDPDGKFVVEPVLQREEILYAEINPAHLRGPRWQLDVAGHYGRPDVFRFAVDRRHFVSTSPWDTGPLEAVLVEKAQAMLGGPRAVLIIDDTALVKQGKHSAGVAQQYANRSATATNASRGAPGRDAHPCAAHVPAL
ncbi:MAG TPA: nitrilase-related carbon-nitrogen hydrolase, partial [Chloroflexota bacterium]|nr:nitrilase-related carbon-nitrogen hydrolase [Chloroflexota bacterium]